MYPPLKWSAKSKYLKARDQRIKSVILWNFSQSYTNIIAADDA